MFKPYSQACMNNQGPILEVIEPWLSEPATVLEIGSGTGQHAIAFGHRLPHIRWQTSDLPDNHEGILAWQEEEGRENILPPLTLDVTAPWPVDQVDHIFSANTCHIMPWTAVEALFAGIGRHLKAGGLFFLYGPFNYGGDYTSDSNERFDLFLKAQNPEQGLRDVEKITGLAQAAGLELQEDHAMPANNRLLVWRKG